MCRLIYGTMLHWVLTALRTSPVDDAGAWLEHSDSTHRETSPAASSQSQTAVAADPDDVANARPLSVTADFSHLRLSHDADGMQCSESPGRQAGGAHPYSWFTFAFVQPSSERASTVCVLADVASASRSFRARIGI